MDSRQILRRVWRPVRLGLVIYLLLVLLLMIFEEQLIFFPIRHPGGQWGQQPVDAEDAHFVAADGTRLHGWYLPHEDPVAAVLMAHGNAGNLTHRSEIVRQIHRHARASVLIFDYRGYGKSEGKPSEAGILQDARAGRDWLAGREGIAPNEVVLLGRSIGTGVMVDLAARDGAAALVLDGAFTSLPEVAAVHYPWAPVKLLMRTRLNSAEKISRYRGPLLQFHGADDQIIPISIGRRLFEIAPSRPKQFIRLPHCHHNTPPPPKFYSSLAEFLDSAG